LRTLSCEPWRFVGYSLGIIPVDNLSFAPVELQAELSARHWLPCPLPPPLPYHQAHLDDGPRWKRHFQASSRNGSRKNLWVAPMSSPSPLSACLLLWLRSRRHMATRNINPKPAVMKLIVPIFRGNCAPHKLWDLLLYVFRDQVPFFSLDFHCLLSVDCETFIVMRCSRTWPSVWNKLLN
jgi:hypothetical protein